jgi:hypothetical protein
LRVPALQEIWDQLERNPRLGSIAAIHRGIEWEQPFDEQKYISRVAKPGFKKGLHKVEGIRYFRAPLHSFLCTKPQYRRRKAWELPWERPKALLNVCRISRGQWCLASFPEEHGLIASENFGAAWPGNHWTPKTLAAVLNGPIANAFVACSESEQQRIRISALRNIPTPALGRKEVDAIDGLVDRYIQLIEPRSRHTDSYRSGSLGFLSTGDLPLFKGHDDDPFSRAKEVLLAIDAAILRAYGLPPRMERELLDFFRDATTPRPVPFTFGQYFPDSFVPTIPLWMFISDEYKKCSADLFLKDVPSITDPVLIEALREVE